MSAGRPGVALDEDFHVHSTFSDGQSHAGGERARRPGARPAHAVPRRPRPAGHRLAAASSPPPWRPSATSRGRGSWPASRPRSSTPPAGLTCRRGLDGIDLVLIADHQFPGDDGPVHPDRGAGGHRPRRDDRRPRRSSGSARRRANALTRRDRGRVLAHLFSVLPKIGLDEAMVPEAAARPAGQPESRPRERWSRSTRSGRARRRARSPPWRGRACRVVAGSDSHHCRDVGVYRSVRLTAGAGATGLTASGAVTGMEHVAHRRRRMDPRRSWCSRAAVPELAGAWQFLLAACHRWRNHYGACAPVFPRTAVLIPAWNEGAVIGGVDRPADGGRVPAGVAARLRGRRREHRRHARWW